MRTGPAELVTYDVHTDSWWENQILLYDDDQQCVHSELLSGPCREHLKYMKKRKEIRIPLR